MVHATIENSRVFSQNKIEVLRNAFDKALSFSQYKNHITVVTTGSYGRGEASEESDLDWFIIFDRDLDPSEAIREEIQKIGGIVSAEIKKEEGDSKTFGQDAVVRFSDMQTNIGGQQDTNESLTRRMLFLLEGTWLYGKTRFKEYRRALLEKYIKPDASDEQLPRFFLNDLIRYYRTITTDFEFKTAESGKSWGLRNIKLRFSRKLLYFGGVIVVAEMNQLTREQKINQAEHLFDLNALSRITALGAGCDQTQVLLDHYEGFLNRISDSAIREALEQVVKEERMGNPVYRELREASVSFSEVLHQWLNEKYPDHPIHHALVF
ncbi:MAG: nucleotidyltransferase domain-containing protein [Marinospirillum sp.]|uniref:nucleotidyltransferase domain-containing protein n=1 Tax=Marinospirillum sp. TaxID=2183934 RepID=UPI0019FA1D69|nr:nucleotidyltransferase domain-containing protein [Marinospirillum sp.]MBE0505964.1 nucleotidyltransferase domain-containing protein [Marinospirillum sp.]